MKKTFVFVLFAACAVSGYCEEMRFVTTLSSPLGTFAQLETADYRAVTSVPLVNFCNSRSGGGTVALKGADTYLQTLNLKNAATLGGNAPEYRIGGALNAASGGDLTAARLLADKLNVTGASDAKSNVSDTLYADSLTVKGAKTESLTIENQVQTAANAQGTTGTDLYWSNAYNCTYKGGGEEGSGTMKREGDVRSVSPGTLLSDTCDGSIDPFTGYKSEKCNDVSFRIVTYTEGCYKFNTDGTPVGVCSTGAAYANYPQVPSTDCSNTFGGGTACLCSNLPSPPSTDLTNRKWYSSGKSYTLPQGDAEDILLLGANAVTSLKFTVYGDMFNKGASPLSVSNKFLRKSSPDGQSYSWTQGSYSGTAVFHECIFPYKGKYYGVYVRGGIVERTMAPEGGGEPECDGKETFTSYLLKTR